MAAAETPKEGDSQDLAAPIDRIKINVGGQLFTFASAVLLHHPTTKLGKFAAMTHEERLLEATGYISADDQYYFERSPVQFQQIANFYVDGKVFPPVMVCPLLFQEEMKFWGIPQVGIGEEPVRANGSIHETQTAEFPEHSYCPRIRTKVWLTVESLEPSAASVVFAGISWAFLLATAAILVIGSLPTFKVIDHKTGIVTTHPALEICDCICVCWFTFEYLLRLWSSPHLWITFKQPLTVIDLAAIAPFYVELALDNLGVTSPKLGNVRQGLLIIRILRVLRILRAFRILKVARYSSGFQSMGETLKNSWRELSLLVMFMLTTTLVFASAMHLIEGEGNPKMATIPDAAWWCIITMTTVGYGDVFPTTTLGKVVASLVSISGIILLAFPISIVVENFNNAYRNKDKVDRRAQKLSQYSIRRETSTEMSRLTTATQDSTA